MADFYLPYPWDGAARIVVVRAKGQDWIALQNFQNNVLYSDGPMPLSIDMLKVRMRGSKAPQLFVDAQHDPDVLAALKRHYVVGARTARVGLASFAAIEHALVGFQPQMVECIMSKYREVAQRGAQHGPSGGMAVDGAAGDVPAAPLSVPAVLPPPSTAAAAAAAGAAAATPTAPATAAAEVAASPPARGQQQPPTAAPLPPVAPAFPPPRGRLHSLLDKVLSSINASAQKRQLPAPEAASQSQGNFADWPMQMPVETFTPRSLKEDYGLITTLPNFVTDPAIPLGPELLELEAFCKEPFHFGRGVAYPNPIKDSTFEGLVDTVQAFTGYLFKVGVGNAVTPLHPADQQRPSDPPGYRCAGLAMCVCPCRA